MRSEVNRQILFADVTEDDDTPQEGDEITNRSPALDRFDQEAWPG